MNIIQKQPNPSGAYPPIQSWSDAIPPDTHYEITCDYSEFFNGFIIPTVENGVVISFICNTTEREKWKSSLPTPQPPQPTETEKLRADVDFLAVMTGVTI